MKLAARLRKIRLPKLLEGALKDFAANDGTSLAAGIAFYGFVTIFPLILALIGVAGQVLPSEQIQYQIFTFIEENVPWATDIIRTNIEGAIRLRGTLSSAGLIGLILAGSGLFGVIGHAINRAWDIDRQRPFYLQWLRNIALTLGLGVLLILSIGATAFTSIPSDFFSTFGRFPDLPFNLMSFFFAFILFLILFKIMPNTKIYWRHIWFAALITAIAFQSGGIILLYYFTRVARYQLIYGSVASAIALLLWIYYSSFILIFGAEVAAEYGRMRRGIHRSLRAH